MLKKINKQREKIEKLMHKESDAADRLESCRQELAEEKAALDEMEKEYLFSLVRGKKLSLEETIAILENETPLAAESAEDDSNLAAEDTEESGSFFSRFGKKDDDEDDLWK